MNVSLDTRTLTRLLSGTLAAVIACGLLAEVADHVLRLEDPYDLIEFFGLSYEHNFPTWVVSKLLFACGVLLALIALATQQRGDGYVRHWWALSAVFFYISLDELVMLHEEMNDWFDYDGLLYFGWIIPASVAVSIFALAYIRFLRALPGKTASAFVAAGAIYVAGALLVELPLGYWTDRFGADNFTYAMIDLVEESLELLGVGVFLVALIAHIGEADGRITVAIGRRAAKARVNSGTGRARGALGDRGTALEPAAG